MSDHKLDDGMRAVMEIMTKPLLNDDILERMRTSTWKGPALLLRHEQRDDLRFVLRLLAEGEISASKAFELVTENILLALPLPEPITTLPKGEERDRE